MEEQKLCICGFTLVEIRGRYPDETKREVCATCLQEKVERIHEETSSCYGKGEKTNAI